MSDDLKEAAMKAVQRKAPVKKPEPDSTTQQSKLYKEYYSLETGEPIAFEVISKRIRRRFADIDKSSAMAMMDLWFLHAQWISFYSRTDSFSKYIREELQISKTHAYAILNSVELLNQYFIHKGNTDSEISTFVNQICSSIEDIGIKKLSILSKIGSDEERFDYLDRLLGGEQITAEKLLEKPEKQDKPEKIKTMVKMSGNDLMVGKTLVLTFNSENKIIRNAVLKAVEKWYINDHQPKAK
jgi:hypothetical protein